MAAIDLTPETQAEFTDRIGKLQADTPRQWGAMTPIEMIAHLDRSMVISLGEIEVKDESNFFLRSIIRPIFFSGLFEWPKGKLKVMPIFMGSPEGNIETGKEKLIASITRFIEKADAEPNRRALHPAFGVQPTSFFRRMHGLHMDHHLRQFGV